METVDSIIKWINELLVALCFLMRLALISYNAMDLPFIYMYVLVSNTLSFMQSAAPEAGLLV